MHVIRGDNSLGRTGDASKSFLVAALKRMRTAYIAKLCEAGLRSNIVESLNIDTFKHSRFLH